MKYRKLTIKQYHDVMKHCPEFVGFGVNEAVLQSHNMLFPDDKVVVPQQISFTPEQQKRLQYLMDTMCDLIENTEILRGSTASRSQLVNTNILDLPHMLQLVLLSVLSNRDAELVGKYIPAAKRKPTTRGKTKVDLLRTKDKHAALKENVVAPAASKTLITQRRRWFINKFNATPEDMYIAAIFYIVDYMFAFSIRNRKECGMYGGTILKLAALATQNAAKKRAAKQSAFERQ